MLRIVVKNRRADSHAVLQYYELAMNYFGSTCKTIYIIQCYLFHLKKADKANTCFHKEFALISTEEVVSRLFIRIAIDLGDRVMFSFILSIDGYNERKSILKDKEFMAGKNRALN